MEDSVQAAAVSGLSPDGPSGSRGISSAAGAGSSRRGRWVWACTWGYAAWILAVLGLIGWIGEDWWGVTVLLFIPRWLYLGPITLLALASAWVRCPRHWATQGAIALVVAGPLMGLSVPLGTLMSSRPRGMPFRILCYNLGELPVDASRLTALLEREKVDLICFQEGRNKLGLAPFFKNGWYRDRKGSVASRYPIVEEMAPLPDDSTTEDRMTALLTHVRIRVRPGVEFVLASVHMPTLRPGLNRFLDGNYHGLSLHVEWWASELNRVVHALAESQELPVLVGGDFNMPSDDASMTALRSIFRFGFEDSGWGYGYTRPSSAPWFRIDHLMASPDWVFTRCWVGPNCGSDHLPLLAEVVLTGVESSSSPTAP